MKIKGKYIFIGIVALFFIGSFLIYAGNNAGRSTLTQGIGRLGGIHEHSDAKIYLDGQLIDLRRSEYQLQAQHVHVEGGDGDIIHTHADGVTMAYFLSTIGIALEENGCVKHKGLNYCPEGDKKLRFYINGEDRTSEISSHVLGGLDQYLVSFGTEQEAVQQLDSVTSRSSQVEGTDMDLRNLPAR